MLSKVFWIMLIFNGYTMTFNATELYGIGNMSSCQRELPKIIKSYEALEGFCYTSRMIQYFKNARI